MLLAVLAVAVVLAIFIFELSRDFRHKLKLSRNLPGPPTTLFFGNSLELGTTPYQLSKYILKVAEEYAEKGENVLRFWICHHLFVLPINGEGAKEILESSEELSKGHDYDFYRPWLLDGLLTSEGPKWKRRRRQLTPTFHFSMLDGYVDAMNSHAKKLIEIMGSKKQRCVDVYPLIKRCALDIICETTMGKDLHSQYEPNQPYVVAIQRMMEIGITCELTAYLWIPFIYRMLPISREFDKHLNVEKTFVRNVIQERIAVNATKNSKSGKREAFLDGLLKLKEQGELTMEDIEEETTTFMFAGHDTTGNGMSWITWALACNPEHQEKVYEELQEIFGDSDRDCTIEDIKLMKYLDRFIKETMRLFPPVPFISRNLKNDFKMGKYNIPGKIDCTVSPLVIHNNKQIYPNPDVFDPDRFLPENVSQRHPYDYIPFSAGPRNCIGQKFAMYEEKVVTSWIVRSFKLSSSVPMLSKSRIPEVILRPDDGVEIMIQKRRS